MPSVMKVVGENIRRRMLLRATGFLMAAVLSFRVVVANALRVLLPFKIFVGGRCLLKGIGSFRASTDENNLTLRRRENKHCSGAIANSRKA